MVSCSDNVDKVQLLKYRENEKSMWKNFNFFHYIDIDNYYHYW